MRVERIKIFLKVIIDLIIKYQLKFPSVILQHIIAKKKYRMGFRTFISLRYMDMSREQKESLLHMPEYISLCFKINPSSQLKTLRDKRTVIHRLPQYLGRECLIESFTDETNFLEFAKRHTAFFAKKNFNAAGKGTRVFKHVNTEQDRKNAYQICKDSELTIIEEFITQHPVLSCLYPHVVNTIRIHTIRGKSGIQIVLLPELYVPLGGVTDTVHTRCKYFIFIDPHSGKLWDKAFRTNALGIMEYGETYHCDTGTVFGDITIPYWDKVQAMVIDAASHIPELPYIGWDVAITPDGPVIIEGNAISGAMGSYQIRMSLINGGYGVKKEYEEIFSLVDSEVKMQEGAHFFVSALITAGLWLCFHTAPWFTV